MSKGTVYYVLPFSLDASGDTIVLSTYAATTHLAATSTIAQLKLLLPFIRQNVDFADLSQSCWKSGVNTHELISTGSNLGILRETTGLSTRIKRVLVETDNDALGAAVSNYLASEEISICELQDGPDVICVALLNYVPARIANIYESSSRLETVILTAFRMGRTFTIDSPYSVLSGLPCHFCQMSWRETRATAGSEQKECALRDIDIGFCANRYLNRLGEITRFDGKRYFASDLMQFKSYSLDSDEQTNGLTPHMTGCQCLR